MTETFTLKPGDQITHKIKFPKEIEYIREDEEFEIVCEVQKCFRENDRTPRIAHLKVQEIRRRNGNGS